jgi:redox-sensitive bicupin YhaK (pirin superfamily)
MFRKVKKVISGKKAVDGAGVHLTRVIGYHDVKDFDPFLLLDSFDSRNPEDYIKGFPWHPHRGIETVTYLIEGHVKHGDSLGNSGNIFGGDCQWMTAGSGILHQEMPQVSDLMLGTQLWINLPSKDKMTKPKYRDITKDNVAVVYEEDVEVRVISGVYKNTKGAMESEYVKATFLDIKLSSKSEWIYKTNIDDNVFVFLICGEGIFEKDGSEIIPEKSAVLFDRGEEIIIKSTEKDLRVFLFSGKALKEEIAWGGPIVMNTKEELNKAFEELDNGSFIKK